MQIFWVILIKWKEKPHRVFCRDLRQFAFCAPCQLLCLVPLTCALGRVWCLCSGSTMCSIFGSVSLSIIRVIMLIVIMFLLTAFILYLHWIFRLNFKSWSYSHLIIHHSAGSWATRIAISHIINFIIAVTEIGYAVFYFCKSLHRRLSLHHSNHCFLLAPAWCTDLSTTRYYFSRHFLPHVCAHYHQEFQRSLCTPHF